MSISDHLGDLRAKWSDAPRGYGRSTACLLRRNAFSDRFVVGWVGISKARAVFRQSITLCAGMGGDTHAFVLGHQVREQWDARGAPALWHARVPNAVTVVSPEARGRGTTGAGGACTGAAAARTRAAAACTGAARA